MAKRRNDNAIIIYQAKSGALELRRDADHSTIWATQAEMAKIFDVTPQNITLHLRNIFKDGELDIRSTCKDHLQVQKEGDRKIKRNVRVYNLDAMIAVGYRINSVVGTKFRQWATKTLRQYVVEGYAIDRKRVGRNYERFMGAVARVRQILPSAGEVDAKSVLELVNMFADTWLSLDAYDKGALAARGATKKRVTLTAEQLGKGLADFKATLLEKGEATEHFGMERERESVKGVVGNVMQSFGGRDVYGTVEAKAAHLLYFIVKNHPFVDGNKRSGAYAFIWFLRRAGVLNTAKLTPPALTALTLLVAESDPKDKEKVTDLVAALIAKKV